MGMELGGVGEGWGRDGVRDGGVGVGKEWGRSRRARRRPRVIPVLPRLRLRRRLAYLGRRRHHCIHDGIRCVR